jgi:hypothetical protein
MTLGGFLDDFSGGFSGSFWAVYGAPQSGMAAGIMVSLRRRLAQPGSSVPKGARRRDFPLAIPWAIPWQ